jgi:hypothetical protein
MARPAGVDARLGVDVHEVIEAATCNGSARCRWTSPSANQVSRVQARILARLRALVEPPEAA